jgi:Uma2 family endonuclease
MNVMTAPGVWADQTKELTVKDMENMPDDEFRYELDDGMLIMLSVPSVLHQHVVLRLALALDAVCPPELEAIIGVGVNINRHQHRVPDVAVVRADSMDTVFQEQAPALVVEVASPRTGLYDRSRKKDVYERFGIPAYWIVEPERDKPELTAFQLCDGRYERVAHLAGDEAYMAELPFPVTATPSALVGRSLTVFPAAGGAASRSASPYPASPGTLTSVIPPTEGDSVAMIWNVAATTRVATAKYPPDRRSTSADTGSATTAALGRSPGP